MAYNANAEESGCDCNSQVLTVQELYSNTMYLLPINTIFEMKFITSITAMILNIDYLNATLLKIH